MLIPGTVLQSRYRIIRQIGGGGQALVYLAEDTNLSDLRAIKELTPDANASPQEQQAAYDQFEREARILIELNHPNLVWVWDHFRVGGNAYLVMDYIDGQTLQEIMEQSLRFLPEAAILRWAGQLCDVLDYLHRQQPPIIFRDLKPSNVMHDRSDTVKLIDFGIVRFFQPGKKTDTLKMGTLGYAPPEQYAGKGQTDTRSDVYSLGATLHHLLTKRDPTQHPPFSFDTAPPRSLNPAISPRVEAAITKALAYDRVHRFQSALEMKRALMGAPAPMPTVTIPRTAPRRRIELRWPLLGLAAFLVLLCCLCTGLASLISPPPEATPTPIPTQPSQPIPEPPTPIPPTLTPTTFSTFCNTVTEIPQAECRALVALYNSADGANWRHNDDWLDTSTPCSWYGVKCSEGHVTQLNMLNNHLAGTMPSELGNLSKLQVLDFWGNGFTGSLPPELGNLTGLRTFRAYGNVLTGEIPPELGHLTNLEILVLSTNHLSGSIPPELGNLVNLRELHLHSNWLSGCIPSELGNLVNLQILHLTNNGLSDGIPAELGNLVSLRHLNLYNNHLSGSIPPEFGKLANLQKLSLNRNQLSGSIPTELGNLANLQELYLDNTQLSGALPGTLTNLTKLSLFWFHDTDLCEPADAAFQTWLDSISDLQSTSVTCHLGQ